LRPRLTTGLPLSTAARLGDGNTLTRRPHPRKSRCKHPLACSANACYTGAMSVREQLLESAAQLYAEAGYRGATTRRIADHAGVNEITLFRHFGSKDALIREAITKAGSSFESQALPDPPRDPARELREWAQAHIAALRKRRALIRTCMGEIEEHPGIFSAENSAPAAAAKALGRYLGRLRETGQAKAQFDEVAASAMLMGVLFADAMGRDIMPDMYRNDPDEALEEYIRLFLRSVGVGRRRNTGAQ
jgi:AcrR family transcriptional regulator